MKPPESPPPRASGTESIADLILGPEHPRRSRGLVWAVLATVSLHGAAGAFAWQAWRSGASRLPPPAAPNPPPLRVDHVVELPPEPPPPPVQAPPPRVKVKAPGPVARAAPSPRPAPAQAGAVVAAKEAEAPLDFTGFDIASGQAPRYAGGVTASTGRSTTAVAPSASTGDSGAEEGGQARPVQLPARNWSCPWPREADALRIDEQTVVLRVVVTPEGHVRSAELLADPGHGFGQAALACARDARFEAAHDAKGRPLLAASPPIRVRFKRR